MLHRRAHRTWPNGCRVATMVAAMLGALTVLLATAGGVAGAVPATDAELLALEISGELLPPLDLAAQIGADLAAIRAHDPYFESFHVFTDWIPGMLLVTLTPAAWNDFMAGRFDGWDLLNAQYAVTVSTDTIPVLRLVRLVFTQPYHPGRLAALYAGIPGIDDARPGMQSDGFHDIEAEVLVDGSPSGTYVFMESWAECSPAGCYVYQHGWVFAVSAAGVALVEQRGDPLLVEPRTWGGIKSLYREDDR